MKTQRWLIEEFNTFQNVTDLYIFHHQKWKKKSLSILSWLPYGNCIYCKNIQQQESITLLYPFILRNWFGYNQVFKLSQGCWRVMVVTLIK